MASEPILAAFDLPVGKRNMFSDSKIWFDYFALTKPEVNFLIVVTTFAGFYLGSASTWHDFPLLRSINAVLGTLLVASGTGALNQYIERRFDAQMRRTSRRPLAAGRLNPEAVLGFGIVLSVLGTFYLAATVNLLASLLALATLLSYLFLYTPLKRKSSFCTWSEHCQVRCPRLLDGQRQPTGSASGPGYCTPYYSFGSSRILWRSLGCTGRITVVLVTLCCRAMSAPRLAL